MYFHLQNSKQDPIFYTNKKKVILLTYTSSHSNVNLKHASKPVAICFVYTEKNNSTNFTTAAMVCKLRAQRVHVLSSKDSCSKHINTRLLSKFTIHYV